MSRFSLSGNLRDAAFQKGADLFGIADASCFLHREYTGMRPSEIMPGIGSVIIIGVSIPRGAFGTLPRGESRIHEYPHGRDSDPPNPCILTCPPG